MKTQSESDSLQENQDDTSTPTDSRITPAIDTKTSNLEENNTDNPIDINKDGNKEAEHELEINSDPKQDTPNNKTQENILESETAEEDEKASDKTTRESPALENEKDSSADLGSEIDGDTPEANVDKEIESKTSASVTHSADRDSIGAESKIGELNVYNLYGEKARSHFPSKEFGEKTNILDWQISYDALRHDRQAYLERPGYKESLALLDKSQQLLLVTGPQGCGLHASIKALCSDLFDKQLSKQREGKIYSFPHIVNSSPDLLLRDSSSLKNSIVLIEEGIQTQQSFIVRLLQERGASSFEVVNDQLRKLNCWMIISGPKDPTTLIAKEIYGIFQRHKRLAELNMPDMSALFRKIINHIDEKQAEKCIDFLSRQFPGVLNALRTSQDVEFFAKRYYDIFIKNSENEDELIKEIDYLIKNTTSIQREVRRLFEEDLLESDIDTLLAILLSVLNGVESNIFWEIFDYLKNSPLFNDPKRVDNYNKSTDKEDEKEQVAAKTRSFFATSRIAQLHKIEAEEKVVKVIVDNQEVVRKSIQFLDERFARAILEYARMSFDAQIKEICVLLQKRFVQEERNPQYRILVAKAIAALAQANWDEAFIPIISDWAISHRPYVRSSVGYALDEVLTENQYTGNLRYLLNKWCTEPIRGENGLYIKWTVASACKQLGLRDIKIGLEFLRKLTEYLGQRDLGKANSTKDLISMIFDSQIESHIVYLAIQYSMVVFCLQGYIQDVMEELQNWIIESPEKNPLSLVATILILGIFQEFGYHAIEARDAGNEAEWAPDVLQEWNIQVISTSKKAYICNRMLQYIIQKRNDNQLFEAIKMALARTYVMTRNVNKQGLIFAIFFQWIDELGQDNNNINLRETTFQLQKLFINMCRELDAEYIEEIRSQITFITNHQDDYPVAVINFAKRISRDLNAPSLRYMKKA